MSDKTKLTAENVNNIFLSCLFNNDEPKENYVVAEGVSMKIGFHPERLNDNKKKIEEMLDCLPDNFKKFNGGGGWSFLNMCDDKDDNQWTDFHKTMDELVCLGIAIKKVEFLMPREMWKSFPGGMPYLVIN